MNEQVRYWTVGPAAATSAGLVPFALGTETGGSIIYPANTCGVTAHRTSFGLVGRSNIMSLSESLVCHPALSPFFTYCCCIHCCCCRHGATLYLNYPLIWITVAGSAVAVVSVAATHDLDAAIATASHAADG